MSRAASALSRVKLARLEEKYGFFQIRDHSIELCDHIMAAY
jgi:hypothetical protein